MPRLGRSTSTRSAPATKLCASESRRCSKSTSKEQDFLKSSPEPAPTVDQPPISERPGHEIGRYKLLQKIGEGGFGVVYMAEQQRPVRRKVALKIIKPGMDTQAVVATF